jgi:MFS family permease
MSRPRRSFAFLCAGHTATHLSMLIFPTAVLALAPAWQRGYDSLIALGTIGFVTYAAGTLPAGWLGDRWSRTGMMTVFFIGLGLSLILTGFARDPLELGLGLGAIGLFASIYHPVGIAHLVEITNRSGQAIGVNGVFGNMGIAGAAITAGGLSAAFGWQAAFIVPGAVVVLLGILYALFARGEASAAAPAVKSAHADATSTDQRRVFGYLVISALGTGLIFNGITVVMPALFAERLALPHDPSLVGAAVSGVTAIAAFAQIVTGSLMNDRRVKPLLIGLTLGQALLFLLIAGAGGFFTVGLALPMLLLVFGEIPASDWLIARYTGAANRARSYAIMYVVSLGVSLFAAPLIAWFHGTSMGFTGLLLLFGGCAALVTAAGFALPGRTLAPAPAPAAARPAE